MVAIHIKRIQPLFKLKIFAKTLSYFLPIMSGVDSWDRNLLFYKKRAM